MLLSSTAFKYTPKGGIVFQNLKTAKENLGIGGKWIVYSQSKLAMVLYARILAKKHTKSKRSRSIPVSYILEWSTIYLLGKSFGLRWGL